MSKTALCQNWIFEGFLHQCNNGPQAFNRPKTDIPVRLFYPNSLIHTLNIATFNDVL